MCSQPARGPDSLLPERGLRPAHAWGCPRKPGWGKAQIEADQIRRRIAKWIEAQIESDQIRRRRSNQIESGGESRIESRIESPIESPIESRIESRIGAA